jgi:hypothetical protein
MHNGDLKRLSYLLSSWFDAIMDYSLYVREHQTNLSVAMSTPGSIVGATVRPNHFVCSYIRFGDPMLMLASAHEESLRGKIRGEFGGDVGILCNKPDHEHPYFIGFKTRPTNVFGLVSPLVDYVSPHEEAVVRGSLRLKEMGGERFKMRFEFEYDFVLMDAVPDGEMWETTLHFDDPHNLLDILDVAVAQGFTE